MARNLGFTDFSSDDIFLLFRRFDAKNTGYLRFNDFSRIMLPFSREYACLVTDRVEYYTRRTQDGTHFFNADTRYEIQAFWSVLLRAERLMETLRARLHHVNKMEIFENCARSRGGMIFAADLRDVLAENGFYATERELQGLMYRLDRD